jgi:hypothetical protein
VASLFFSYSHTDEALRDQLEKHLAALKRGGLVDTWHDRKIVAGDPVDATIMMQLEEADIVLLLVSADFIASDYCFGREMGRALERHTAGECVVIPVVLRACDWKATPFAHLLAVPRDGRPVTQWPDRDEAFLDVAQSVRKALEKAAGGAIPTRVPSTGSPAGPRAASDPTRSSNLRIAKHFSDRDRDRFVLDAYGYVAKYFENSLEELHSRHGELQTEFRTIDAERFTAAVYREGAAASGCTIFLTRTFGPRSIGYASNDSGHTNRFNEQLSVSSDDQSMFFAASMRPEHPHLSAAGAAEHLWNMFVAPLQ